MNRGPCDIDDEGLDAMTMRRVAQELGTGAASLYAYADNKERLLELVIDRALGELEPPPAGDGSWPEELKQGLREVGRGSPAIATSRERHSPASRSARTRCARASG
jgi:AcrR family transcriptional regulator